MTLLNAEIKDDNYDTLPRQQLQAQYAQPANTYLKADASTGKNYVDLNAAAKGYFGPWLFGSEHVQVHYQGIHAQWQQWVPVPAGIADGVLLRGNVMYENPNGSYNTSNDKFEGTIRTSFGERVFEGETQHTFYGRDLPNGSMVVVAKLSIPLNQRLAHNPMMVSPSQQATMANNNNNYRPSSPPVMASTYSNYQTYNDQPGYTQQVSQQYNGNGAQSQDGGF
ncbi:MAG TPA: hypothetical protein V6C76_06675 [Drouetiella sp.]